MAGELLINDDGSIGIGPDGDASVVTDDGRCPVCGCGEYDDGDPTDPPPPIDPDSFYLASPCDPNASPLDRPVVFYVPPRDQWPPGGFDYDCAAASRQEVSGRAVCYFFTSRSPKVSGEVVREPGSPYTTIGGQDYYEVGANPVQSTCCACRDDCGVYRTPYFTEIIDPDPAVQPKACDPDAVEGNKRECCCDADGEITYIGYYRSRFESWLQNPYPPYDWLPTSTEVVQRLSGKKPDDQTPGACTFNVETTESTWRDTGTRLVPEVRTTVQRNLDGVCEGCVWPAFGDEPWECVIPGSAFGCSGFVEYACNTYRGRRECKIDNGPLIPAGSILYAWSQTTVFAQGDCTAGCDNDNQATARPSGSSGLTATIAPGGVPRLF